MWLACASRVPGLQGVPCLLGSVQCPCRQVEAQSSLESLPVVTVSPGCHWCCCLQEDEIQKAIFVGNYEGAVDTCLKTGRLADALLIANIGGAELFKKTMHRYMRLRTPGPTWR